MGSANSQSSPLAIGYWMMTSIGICSYQSSGDLRKIKQYAGVNDDSLIGLRVARDLF